MFVISMEKELRNTPTSPPVTFSKFNSVVESNHMTLIAYIASVSLVAAAMSECNRVSD